MFAPRSRGALLVIAVIAAACGGGGESTGTNNNTPSAVAIVSGNGQAQIVGQPLPAPLVVKVTGPNGPVQGASVTFAVISGTATVSPATTSTDASGQAQTQVTLGAAPGNVTITAAVNGTSLIATFVVTAGTSQVTTACSTSSPQGLAAGGVLPGVTGTGICLAGGTTGADFALVAFYGNPDSSQVASLTVRSQNATALTSASIAPAFSTTVGGLSAQTRSNDLQTQFDLHLRSIARRELTPMIPAARARMRSQGGAAFSAIPSSLTLNQVITLNANGNDACSNAINVRARVAAISNTAYVLADTGNPVGGFTDAEYASFATTFDTLVNPLDVNAFGQPTDIDKNGKIVILFTKEVNKLTPKGSNGVIGGFFFERDLFPTTTTPTLEGCPTSNVGEMFYALVPDSLGTFSDVRKKPDVLNVTISTLAHEYQHLINAGRRLYVNNANAFEDVWLNEGLSHIAEELLYYRESGNTPRENLTARQIGANQAAVNAFNNDQGDNFGRYEVFLGKPNATSVYAGNDSLETRGATWNLLRYLADHRGSSDADTWQQLVNTTLTGQQNLAHVFGSSYMTQIRDWATSVFADDIPGVTDTRFLEPSWNMRDIFPNLVDGNNTKLGRFPLKVFPLSDAAPVNVSVNAGGAAYIRFSVPANANASIDWTSGGLPVNSLMQFTVVRSR